MLMLIFFLPCVFNKACLLFCLQTCLLLLLSFQPCLFNEAGLVFSLHPLTLLLRYQPCLFNDISVLFSLRPCMLMLLCSPSRFKGEADPSSTFRRAHSCSSVFGIAYSASRSSSSAFSHNITQQHSKLGNSQFYL